MHAPCVFSGRPSRRPAENIIIEGRTQALAFSGRARPWTEWGLGADAPPVIAYFYCEVLLRGLRHWAGVIWSGEFLFALGCVCLEVTSAPTRLHHGVASYVHC